MRVWCTGMHTVQSECVEQGATILGLGSIETSEGNKRLGDLPAGETGGNREGKREGMRERKERGN